MPVYAALSSKGGVASQIHSATIGGLKILEKGGNAFDAAITISRILTVMLPNTSSAGGDGFLFALDCGSEITAYNGSGGAPQNLAVEEYLTEKPVTGPHQGHCLVLHQVVACGQPWCKSGSDIFGSWVTGLISLSIASVLPIAS